MDFYQKKCTIFFFAFSILLLWGETIKSTAIHRVVPTYEKKQGSKNMQQHFNSQI